LKTGVLYYNHGTQCLVRLAVSMLSLRDHYEGSVAIAAEGNPPEWFKAIAAEFGATIVPAPISHEYGLVKKSRVHRVSPFEFTLFLDADTIVRGPIDEIFYKIIQTGLVVTQFNDWGTGRGRMKRRIQQWESKYPKLCEKAYEYGKAINTGIFGYAKKNEALEDYHETTLAGLKIPGMSRKTLDEVAMQLIVTKYPHAIMDGSWNTGCVHGDPATARIIHYHGHKHCRDGAAGDIWKREFKRLVGKFPQFKTQLESGCGDDSIAKWIYRGDGFRSDMTIVTAVNPLYADRAQKNIETWMQTPGLREQEFLVFVNGFKNAKQRKFLERPNIRVERWRYPHEATPRETMLAAFVFGTAEHVTTQFWMKLDCDASPKKAFTWPDYYRNDITSHKWGYTKMKGDPSATEHWFEKLDKLFAKNPLFSPPPDKVQDFKLSHRPGNKWRVPWRFASFCHIESTGFTQRMVAAIRAKNGDRLPIPSHDTLCWYFATLWKCRVGLKNFKEFFNV